MTWSKFSDDFLEDDTIMSLHDRSYRLFVSSVIYSSRNLTDGVLTPKAIRVLEAILGYKAKRYAAELVEQELWIVMAGGGYLIRNYLKYNRPAAKVKEEREKARKRMATVRGQAECSLERSGEHNGERSGERSGTPPRPDLAPLLLLQAPTRDAAPNGHDSELWKRLLLAAGARTEAQARKLERAVAARRSSTADIVAAIEAATGPGVRDRLAVALSELVKRSEARSA